MPKPGILILFAGTLLLGFGLSVGGYGSVGGTRLIPLASTIAGGALILCGIALIGFARRGRTDDAAQAKGGAGDESGRAQGDMQFRASSAHDFARQVDKAGMAPSSQTKQEVILSMIDEVYISNGTMIAALLKNQRAIGWCGNGYRLFDSMSAFRQYAKDFDTRYISGDAAAKHAFAEQIAMLDPDFVSRNPLSATSHDGPNPPSPMDRIFPRGL